MQCQTVLPGTECTFMAKSGCSFLSGSCQVIVENCEGCDRIVNGSIGQVCSAYPAPAKKWINGLCNFATHAKQDIQTADAKINPMKTSKKGAGKK